MATNNQKYITLLFLYFTLYNIAYAATRVVTEVDWRELTNKVSGRLYAASPLGRPCFTSLNGEAVSFEEAQCSTTEKNYFNGTFRTDRYEGFFHLYGDGCISNTTDECFLNPNDPRPSTDTRQCGQGLVSPYYLDVRNADDVRAAYHFSSKTGIPISIKASGHDYLTRSSMKGSLALWVRNLRNMTYHKSFKATGDGRAKSVSAITFGPGVNTDEAQAFANKNNVTLIGPSSPTVAVVGGWSLFGGHSVLSPAFGLGVDRILEVEIVTPDGEYRICNRKRNIDLFWALRGAGGGVFGVILSVTVKVEPATPVTFVSFNFPPTVENQDAFLSLLINNTRTWSLEGWGGPMSPRSVALVNPYLDETAATKSMAIVSKFVNANNGTAFIQRFATFYEFYSSFISRTPSDAGSGPLLTFRVLPKRLHETTEGRKHLHKFIMNQVRQGLSPTIFMTTPAQFKYPSGSTSVHPAWRNSYWDVGFGFGYAPNATLHERRRVALQSQQLSLNITSLAPDGAAYPNEANPWQQNWQKEFWGNNYKRLLQIKAKYDPHGILNCWRCVGFQNEWIRSNPRFGCMGEFDGLV
ncbi:6-hydroxy-d-nicotine oxidase [Trichoderma arundinaceum]|uniref:6-hydroxy-d-nicotine oxidase n=1 Tax=Trichoderma arundinaceum TaxID=490622 RepID=A0A395NWW3_TRIAR|nr:6-hydroxy-d-nicotine oxidase [Trichoderma arundinaceum]